VIYVLWAALIALGVYEIWALAKEARDPVHDGLTISEKVWHVTLRHPLVPFVFGMLMGHFFWNRVP
jgi:hypothetical protein